MVTQSYVRSKEAKSQGGPLDGTDSYIDTIGTSSTTFKHPGFHVNTEDECSDNIYMEIVISPVVGTAFEDIWVVVPAYREELAIGNTLAQISQFLPNIVVVDDGSGDKTGTIARSLGASVVSHPINLGQGASLQTGIDFALASGAKFICTFDADGQHDPSTIALMHRRLLETDADIVLGSRFLGSTVNMPMAKRYILRAAIAFTRFQTKLPLTDTHNGLRMFTRSSALRIKIRQPGMAHASEILSEIVKLKFKVIEVPTIISYTDYSKAKGQPLSNSVKILLELFYAAICR